jgi:CRP-like cAMP-binding protein
VIENQLLAALSDEERERFLPTVERVSLTLGEVLYEPEEAIHHVYFPNSGVVSMLTILGENASVEVSTVGKEGVVGVPLFLGVNLMLNRAVVQVPGEAMSIEAEAFVDAAKHSGMFHRLLHLYTYTLLSQMSYSVACIRFHNVEKRLARWLLQIQDHVQVDEFQLTQGFIARMVGAKRPHVTTAAGNLQKAGLIRYYRGKIAVLDRDGLKTAACDCYRIIKKSFDDSFGA